MADLAVTGTALYLNTENYFHQDRPQCAILFSGTFLFTMVQYALQQERGHD